MKISAIDNAIKKYYLDMQNEEYAAVWVPESDILPGETLTQSAWRRFKEIRNLSAWALRALMIAFTIKVIGEPDPIPQLRNLYNRLSKTDIDHEMSALDLLELFKIFFVKRLAESPEEVEPELPPALMFHDLRTELKDALGGFDNFSYLTILAHKGTLTEDEFRDFALPPKMRTIQQQLRSTEASEHRLEIKIAHHSNNISYQTIPVFHKPQTPSDSRSLNLDEDKLSLTDDGEEHLLPKHDGPENLGSYKLLPS